MYKFELKKISDLQKIKKLIETDNAFVLKFYFFDDISLKKIKTVVDWIFEKYDKTEMVDIIYNGIKEVIINGVKANLKRIIFKRNNLSLEDEKDIEVGMKLFKHYIIHTSSETIETELKNNNYFVEISFVTEKDGLSINVVNNCTLTSHEEERIRKRFANAMKYENILDFMEDFGDTLEGAGLGIFMFLLMLRKSGVNPKHFRIGTNEQKHTFARIEIPWNENYKTIR